MTCIAGIVDSNHIWLGGDSAGTAFSALQIRSDPKVFSNEGYVMGITGSYRMGQLLRYALKMPVYDESIDINKFMVTDFINAVRTCFKDGGYQYTDNGRDSAGTFLVGFHGHLFFIDSDYQVGELYCSYVAIGAGEDVALGSLYTTRNANIAPRDRIVAALEAAQYHNNTVAGPFVIVSTKDNG